LKKEGGKGGKRGGQKALCAGSSNIPAQCFTRVQDISLKRSLCNAGKKKRGGKKWEEERKRDGTTYTPTST